MTKLNQIYKCNICGNIVEILHTGAGELVCCNQPMQLMTEKKSDEGLEKHVPVIEKTNNTIKISVGSIAHPMINEHYIEWIELLIKGQIIRKELKANQDPQATFNIKTTGNESIKARAYCNLHGLWVSK